MGCLGRCINYSSAETEMIDRIFIKSLAETSFYPEYNKQAVIEKHAFIDTGLCLKIVGVSILYQQIYLHFFNNPDIDVCLSRIKESYMPIDKIKSTPMMIFDKPVRKQFKDSMSIALEDIIECKPELYTIEGKAWDKNMPEYSAILNGAKEIYNKIMQIPQLN